VNQIRSTEWAPTGDGETEKEKPRIARCDFDLGLYA
jgi:hypothetical protein